MGGMTAPCCWPLPALHVSLAALGILGEGGCWWQVWGARAGGPGAGGNATVALMWVRGLGEAGPCCPQGTALVRSVAGMRMRTGRKGSPEAPVPVQPGFTAPQGVWSAPGPRPRPGWYRQEDILLPSLPRGAGIEAGSGALEVVLTAEL